MALVLSGNSILHCLPWFWIAKGGAGDGRYFRPQKKSWRLRDHPPSNNRKSTPACFPNARCFRCGPAWRGC